MTAVTDLPLTAGARRRVLCELADLYSAEQDRGHRPISEGLPGLLGPSLCAAHLTTVEAIDLFARFARARAALMSADADHADMDAAEREAEQLLDELVGEAL